MALNSPPFNGMDAAEVAEMKSDEDAMSEYITGILDSAGPPEFICAWVVMVLRKDPKERGQLCDIIGKNENNPHCVSSWDKKNTMANAMWFSSLCDKSEATFEELFRMV